MDPGDMAFPCSIPSPILSKTASVTSGETQQTPRIAESYVEEFAYDTLDACVDLPLEGHNFVGQFIVANAQSISGHSAIAHSRKTGLRVGR